MSHFFISSQTFKAFLCAGLIVTAVASPLQGQTRKLYLPLLNASDASDLGLAFVNPGLNEAQVTLAARTYNGDIITGNGITNPVTLTLPASSQKALRTVEIFGSKINALTGWVELSASMPAVRGFFVVLDRDLTFIGGTELIATAASRLIFPRVSSVAVSPTQLTLINTSSEPIHTLITLYRDSGQSVVSKIIDLPAYSGFTRSVTDLVPSAVGFEGYAIVDSQVGSDSEGPETLIGIETYRKTSDIALIRAFPQAAQLRTGYLAHLASQGGYSTMLTLINIDAQAQVVRITAEALQVSGRPRIPSSITVERTIPPYARLQESVDRIFNLSGSSLIDGYIRFETQSDTSGVFGFLDYGTTDGVILSAVEAQGDAYSDLFFSQVAEGSGYYTGLALVNPNNRQSVVTLDIFNRNGSRTGSMVVNLRPRERKTRMLSELFQPSMNQLAGYVHITATRPIFAYQFFGSRNVSTFLANVPPQGVRLAPQATGRIVTASNGANVISSDGSPSVLIPPNALSSDTPIGVAPLSVVDLPQPAPNELLVGAVDATPSGTTFRIPVRLNFPLNVQLPPGTQIPLLIFNQSSRQYAPTEFFAVVDATGRAVSAEVSRFATFAVSSPKNQLLTVSGLSALQGVPGTTVTIAGDGFSRSLSDNIVTFSGPGNASVRATVPTATPTSLQATVPDDAVTGPVVVQVGSLSSVGVLFTVPSNNPVPSDVSISPSTVWDRNPTDVRISGIGFLQSSVVNYDGEAIRAEFIDSTLLVITLRKKDLTRGAHRIEVVNPPPGGGTSDGIELNVCIGRSRRGCGTPPPAPMNEAPTVNAGPDQTITLPASANLNGTANDDGLPAGSTVTTTWSKVSGPGTVTFGSVNARTTTASFSTSGIYVLRLTASDTALSSSNDVRITVNAAPPTNQPPTVNAGPNQTITLPASANLNGTASDDGLPAGSTVTTTWSKVSGPGTVTFASVNARTTTASFSASGIYVLRLTASDTALSSTDDITITVNAASPTNQPPTVNAGPNQTITLPASANLNGTASDDGLPAGSKLSRTWSKISGPGSVTFGDVNAQATTASFSAAGTYVLRLTATDTALSASDDVTIVVNAAGGGGNAPVIDAGPAKIIAFPANDLTLFGHATDPNNDPLTVQWTLTNGPAPVTFSAPWALATTVRFTATGTYTFQLAASDGVSNVTSSTTVKVNSTSSQTAFYVDPTSAGAGNGTAGSPWKSFEDGNSNQNAQWSAINSALATNDVIVYFSARQAGSDTAEQILGSSGPGSVIRVRRTDKSSHRLTLDGMSKYSTNDSSPAWADYTGSNKMRLKMSGGCCISIGWDDDVQRDYITIRGFEVTGSGARIRWGGSYSVLENIWVHDVTSLGATVQFNEAVSGSCKLFGIDHDITVRNNLIQRGIGEGIYIAGNYNLAADGGCVSGPNAGDNHYDILIENNTLTDTGINGDQGDGIDLKAGLYNVTVRGNTISFTHAGTPNCSGGDGIVTLGQMKLSAHDSNYLIENNVIHDLGCNQEVSNGMSLGALRSAIIRNNVIYKIPGTGIVAWTRATGATPNNQRIRIYNNTIYAAGSGLAFSDFDDAPVVRNNLLVNNSVSIGGNPPSINSDYNLLSPGGSTLSEGSHSIVRGSTTGIVTNPAAGDFHLASGSPAINKGVGLNATGFATDTTGTPRPQGKAWDIGAYQSEH